MLTALAQRRRGRQAFDAEAELARIEADRISFLPGPPTLFLTMLAHPRLEDIDISSRRVVFVESLPVNASNKVDKKVLRAGWSAEWASSLARGS